MTRPALRRFGIELETFHNTRNYATSQSTLSTELAGLHISARPASYTGQNYAVWQIKTDASIRPSSGANSQSGVEIVSRILPGSEEGIAEARKVADLLHASGYRVNTSTGLHVHLDCSDIPLRSRIAVALRWSLLQDEIKTFLPPSRHAGIYTSFLSGTALTKARDGACGNSVHWGHGERYTACNLEHVGNGRIEFRQAAGTLNANKIEYWVRFLNEFVNDTADIVDSLSNAPRTSSHTAPTTPTSSENVPLLSHAALSRFRIGSRSHTLLAALITSEGGVNADDICRTTGWSRVNFTDTVWALNNAGVPVTRIRRGIYALRRDNTTPASPAAVSTSTRDLLSPEALTTALRRPFIDALSPSVANWIRERKSVFAEDIGAA